ncbi:PH domain-containing protein, partial [Staphylococcus sp. SIMBA_130]
GLAIVVLLVFWLLGIAGTMIKYGKFAITKVGDELFITRGLLEKKQITIPLKRIQAVGIAESVIRQPFGFVTVFVEVAGGALDSGEDFSTV